jgi:hypothetical protein
MMARHEQEREDLLREATALVERCELKIHSFTANVVIGFRRDGALSWYVDPDRAYHFNAAGELRRAYECGSLIKAERGQLVALRRQRSEKESLLLRHDFSVAEQAVFMKTLEELLLQLTETLQGNAYSLVGEVPEGGGVVERVRIWLAGRQVLSAVAHKPGV